MRIRSGRSRGGAAVVASLALVGTGAALTTAPAQSEPVAGDCATAYPVADLVDGAEVSTLTVTKGTAPESFDGTVLGVVDSGIAPGLDMIMVDFGTTGGTTAIDDVGIWQGMSGSPVYTEDGRLLGAVAYGLSWGPSTVAGVTPFEDMDDYLGAAAPPARVEVTKRDARLIAAATDVTRAQADQGFAALPMPTGLSGVSEQRLRKMKRKGPDYLHLKGVRTAGAVTDAAGPESLVAGGNLGAAFSYGDVTFGGIGTVTSVCDDELVGFGHPFQFSGRTTLGLMPADAVYVQKDPVGPGFKVANMGTPAGTIDQDRLTGISGDLGVMPPETLISSHVGYGTRSRTGESHAVAPDYSADVTFSQILGNHDRVFDAIGPGSDQVAVTISGTDADGVPFQLDFGERYTSRWDISFEATYDTADLVWALSRMRGVTLDDVSSDAMVSDSTRAWKIRELQQWRGGAWITLDDHHAAVVRPGGRLRLRVVLAGSGDTRTIRMNLAVPDNARRHGGLAVRGGDSMWSSVAGRTRTPEALAQRLSQRVRNDQVQVSAYFYKRGRDTVVRKVSEPQTRVVRGGEWVELRVRR